MLVVVFPISLELFGGNNWDFRIKTESKLELLTNCTYLSNLFCLLNMISLLLNRNNSKFF